MLYQMGAPYQPHDARDFDEAGAFRDPSDSMASKAWMQEPGKVKGMQGPR